MDIYIGEEIHLDRNMKDKEFLVTLLLSTFEIEYFYDLVLSQFSIYRIKSFYNLVFFLLCILTIFFLS